MARVGISAVTSAFWNVQPWSHFPDPRSWEVTPSFHHCRSCLTGGRYLEQGGVSKLNEVTLGFPLNSLTRVSCTLAKMERKRKVEKKKSCLFSLIGIPGK